MLEKKYLRYMNNFSVSDLKSLLEKDVQEELLKWINDDESRYSKEKIISVIDSIYGTKIFESKEFRRQLLRHGNKDELLFLRDNFLTGKEKSETNFFQVADFISRKTWGKNSLSLKLAEIWELDFSVFEEENEKTFSAKSSIPYDDFFELLDYQFIIKQKALHILNSGKHLERMLIKMPTGTGKTKTAMHIIANYYSFSLKNSGLVIWIAHTKELLEQAYKTFCNVWQHLGNKEIHIHKMYDENKIEVNSGKLSGIAFCSIQSLQTVFSKSSKIKERFKTDCRLIVFDEAHKALAKNTKLVIENLMSIPNGLENRALIGLTATPGRTTDFSLENRNLSRMFNSKTITIEPELLNKVTMGKSEELNTQAETNVIAYFQKRKVLSKINAEKLSYKQSFSEKELAELRNRNFHDEDSLTKKDLEKFAKDRSRNEKILEKLSSLNSQKTPTIVFACSVMHARLLSAMLTLNSIPNSLVLGELKKSERDTAIKNFKENKVSIIINYEVLATGFDSKNIRCVFITRPTKSIVLYSQMIGRGLRGPQMGGNEECLLIDIEDNIKSYDYEMAFSHFDNYWK